jgi:hypothetical protein
MNANVPRLRVIHPVVIHEQTNRPSTTTKGKIHPITGHGGPDEEKRYSSTLYLTSALDGGRWSTPRPGRFTCVWEINPNCLTHCIEGWVAPGPVWTDVKNLFPSGFDPRTVQPWASRYTEFAIPAPNHNYIFKQYILLFNTCHMFRMFNNVIITQ